MTIAIVGLGLIGTSVALAARRGLPGARLLGVDRPDALLHPAVAGVLDAAGPDLTLVGEAEVIVLAAPVDAILQMLPSVGAAARPGALVMDTGSTKRRIVAEARAAGVRGFVGGHPMAGGARPGADDARADLFDGRPWFLVAADGADLARAAAFVARLGAEPVRQTDGGGAHDRLMAAVSHLPQIAASALLARVAEAVGPEGLASAGPGLRDTTRLADSPAESWTAVLATNRDEIAPLLRALAADLVRVADAATPDALADMFARAREARAGLRAEARRRGVS
ncbi:MAG: prephenate dehydrogenase/arogenate dehydrogenase family protein [Acidobacteriota bacterium]